MGINNGAKLFFENICNIILNNIKNFKRKYSNEIVIIIN